LLGRAEEIAAAGADLKFVGNGKPEEAALFQREDAGGYPVFTDPSRRTYNALGMRRSVTATLSPSSAIAAAGATMRGLHQTKTAGDPWQQGGLLVLGPGGRVLYLQQNSSAGDRPDLEAALAAVGAERRMPATKPKLA